LSARGDEAIATLMEPLDSVDLRTMKPAKAHIERVDVWGPAAAVIASRWSACLATRPLQVRRRSMRRSCPARSVRK